MRTFKIRIFKRRAGIVSGIVLIIGWLACNCHALDPPPITPVNTFFVQNANGIPPIPDDLHLTVDGAVGTPLLLSLEDLMDYPATTLMATLECYSPSAELIGNATWTGVSLKTLIDDAFPFSEAETIFFHAYDDYITNGKSLAAMMQRDDIILAYAMNGETLPPEQGYPVRLVMPGSYGFEWIQWIKRIELFAVPPTSDHLNPFPVHAKIFQPRNGEQSTADLYTINGTAFVGDEREITGVEISTDGGTTWGNAQLLNYFVPNVWMHWEFTWEIPQGGEHQIFARAVDSGGTIQEEHGVFGWRSLGSSIIFDVCEGDFDGDRDQDGSDGIAFKESFGRNMSFNLCMSENPCNGDFDCDQDVDGTDAAQFKEDFGRSSILDPCPDFEMIPWCEYP